MVSWQDESATGGDASGSAIRAQVFNADGKKAGAEFLVNTTTASSQDNPAITGLADGRFVVSWQDDSQTAGDTTNTAIRGQIFDPRESAVTLNGSMLADDFVGTRYGDDMSGFVGDDHIKGRSGDDEINGELGEDLLKGNAGNDRLNGGAGDDLLRGGSGGDQLYGGTGNDTLRGGFGLDYMSGGKGDDLFVVDHTGDMVVELTNGGTDLVQSAVIDLDLANYANVENLNLTGAADLNLTGDNENNFLTGNSGKNILSGLGGKDEIHGGGKADEVFGGNGNDLLFGDNGNDKLYGNGGADDLVGGLGRDTLFGGNGADTFFFNTLTETGNSAATRDVITDFNQTQGDLLDLSGIDAKGGPGNQDFAFIGSNGFSATKGELRYKQATDRTIVQGDIDGDGLKDFEIELTGLHTLTAGDFIL